MAKSPPKTKPRTMPQTSTHQPVALAPSFDGRALQFLSHNGRPCVVASNLGEVLGYTDGARLVDKVRGEWAEDFVEGEDYALLTGAELVGFAPPDSGGAKVRHLVVLYETGARMAAIRARTPLGSKVRRWLAGVWSEIARTGRYEVTPAPASSPALDMAAIVTAVLDALERRGLMSGSVRPGAGDPLTEKVARAEILDPIIELATRRAKVDPVRTKRAWNGYLLSGLREHLGLPMSPKWEEVSVDFLPKIRAYIADQKIEVTRREQHAQGKTGRRIRTTAVDPNQPALPLKN